jgi:hypothetical protein
MGGHLQSLFSSPHGCLGSIFPAQKSSTSSATLSVVTMLYVDRRFLPKTYLLAFAPLQPSSDVLKGFKILTLLPVRDV